MSSNFRYSHFIRYWLPVYLYAGLIFFYSSLSAPPVVAKILYGDKIFHFFEYALFGYLIARAGRHSAHLSLRMHFRTFAVAIGAFYGLTDEFHQHFVPGRIVEFTDVLADSLGAFVGQLLLRK